MNEEAVVQLSYILGFAFLISLLFAALVIRANLRARRATRLRAERERAGRWKT